MEVPAASAGPSRFLEVVLGPHRFRDHAVRQRVSAVPGPANDRQDDLAQAGWNAAGLEHLHVVLPDRTLGRLLLHAFGHDLLEATNADDSPWGLALLTSDCH